MITIAKQSAEIISFLRQNLHENLNALAHLEHRPDANIMLYNNNLENGLIIENAKVQRCLYYVATRSPEFMNEFWAALPPVDCVFSGVPKDIAYMFLQGKRFSWKSFCKTYVLTGEFQPLQSSEYKKESLFIEDADEVDKHYAYRSKSSLADFRKCIETRETACIRIDNQLASWVLVHLDDGSIGPLYTKKKFRRKGLAELVLSRQIENLLANGRIPYAQIHDYNMAPLTLIKKFPGMEYSHDCAWFGIDK